MNSNNTPEILRPFGIRNDTPVVTLNALVILSAFVVILERSEESLATPVVTLNEVKGLLRMPEDSSPEAGSE